MDATRFLKKIISMFSQGNSDNPKTRHETIHSSGNAISNSWKKELDKTTEQLIKDNTMRKFSICHPMCMIDKKALEAISIDSIFSGRRVESYVDELSPYYPNLEKREIKELIGDIVFCSRFQFEMFRALRLGLNWYVWHSKSCPKHNKMDRTFIRWNDSPSPTILKDDSVISHHAGDEWGCKCWAEPIVDLSALNIRPPYNVHIDGKIIRMTKKQFLSNFGYEVPHKI